MRLITFYLIARHYYHCTLTDCYLHSFTQSPADWELVGVHHVNQQQRCMLAKALFKCMSN